MTPPPAAAARLDSAPLPLPEKKSAARKAPARADRPFKGIALILASTVFLGASDVTAKYLSATLPSIEIAWIRFLVFALIMSPAMLPGSPLFALRTEPARSAADARRRAAGVVAVLHLRPAVPADRGSLRHRLRRAAVRHRAVDRLSQREGRRAPLDRDRGRPDRRADHPAAGHRRVSSRRVLSDRLGAGLGLHPDHDADDERHASTPSPP